MNKRLEKILDEIQARKIIFDRDELMDWLDKYASYFRSHYNTCLSKEQIIRRKLSFLLQIADSLYWSYDSIFKCIPCDESEIPKCCEEDIKGGMFFYT